MKRYEGLFLFDNTVAHEWPAVEKEVRRLCERAGGQLQVCVKYDERKLAYEIKGRKRGTYVLTYFEAAPERIVDLERDARLSETVLRMLVLRADKISEERLAELKAWPAETPLTPGGGDGRRGYDEPRGRREGGFRRREEGPERARPADKPAGVPAEAAGSAAETPTGAEADGVSAAAADAPAPPPPKADGLGAPSDVPDQSDEEQT